MTAMQWIRSTNIENRVHTKIMEYGEDAIFHFSEDEVRYYQNHLLPLCGDYLIAARLRGAK
jgi:hypothetical protein